MSTYTPKIKPRNSAADTLPYRKKSKHWLTRLNAWLHLWPSIVSGIIVVLVCLTGTIIVYADEIIDVMAGDAKYVEAQQHRVSSEAMIDAIAAKDTSLFLVECLFYKDPDRSTRFRAFNMKNRHLTFIYVNPYTAEVLKIDDKAHFFYVTAHLHADLLAGMPGRITVIIATIIFLISTITGLVLWWPKRWTRKTVKDSFTVKWAAKFKRLNYDLHNVYGFYSLILCFVLGFSGLMISFHSWMDFTVKLAGGATHEEIEKYVPPHIEGKKAVDFVPLAYRVFEEFPNKPHIIIWPYTIDKMGVYVFRAGVGGLKSIENMELSVFDKYTGEPISVKKELVIHEKTENIVWQLHMGQWWGQLGKLSTFLAGIIATSLPITGFIIWWGKRKKKPKQRQVSS